MSDEERSEGTETAEDVEAHKLAPKADEGRHSPGTDEGDDDVEAHKLAPKIAPKVAP